MNHKICYVYSAELINQCNRIPVLKNRADMVHTLIASFFETSDHLYMKPHRDATHEELLLFHSSFYVDYLLKNQKEDKSNNSPDSDSTDDESSDCGLAYDCPKFKNLYNFVCTIAGGTLTAVDCILAREADIAINWSGGWHHAQRDEAEGFCYVNDIGIAIQKLREKFKKILYIDLDIHHGNGVENAFAYSKNILTLSFHQFEPGFFPGSGQIDSIGEGKAKGYSINAPFKRNISGDMYFRYFRSVAQAVFDKFQPNFCLIQCGGDIIFGDPLGGSNLTPPDMGKCVNLLLKWNVPKIFVGGGGYNFVNTARYWAYLTSVICGKVLDDDQDIPDNDYFESYGPDFTLEVTKSHVKDQNSDTEIDENIKTIIDTLNKYHN